MAMVEMVAMVVMMVMTVGIPEVMVRKVTMNPWQWTTLKPVFAMHSVVSTLRIGSFTTSWPASLVA